MLHALKMIGLALAAGVGLCLPSLLLTGMVWLLESLPGDSYTSSLITLVVLGAVGVLFSAPSSE